MMPVGKTMKHLFIIIEAPNYLLPSWTVCTSYHSLNGQTFETKLLSVSEVCQLRRKFTISFHGIVPIQSWLAVHMCIMTVNQVSDEDWMLYEIHNELDIIAIIVGTF